MATLTVRQVICLGRKDILRTSGYLIQTRGKKDVTVQNYKRGTGGRHSYSGTVATVFGASGFLGRYIVNQLGKTGCQVIVPYRGDFYSYYHLRTATDLGQMLFHEIDVKDYDSILKAMKYSNLVINLIGRDYETRNFKYKDVHVDAARLIARATRESGIDKLIHFSSLNASPEPQVCFKRGGSEFLKSKYRGELAVREEFPEAIIFRPADMFGGEDRFMMTYISHMRRNPFFRISLWKKGDATIKQPVFVSDVAQGIMNAMKDPDAAGNTYELLGPHRYYLSDIVDYFWRVCRFQQENNRTNLGPLMKLRAKVFEKFPFINHGEPFFTLDRLEKDHVTDRPTGCPTLEDLNVKLTSLEKIAAYELAKYVQGSYYAESLEEFPIAKPPTTMDT